MPRPPKKGGGRVLPVSVKYNWIRVCLDYDMNTKDSRKNFKFVCVSTGLTYVGIYISVLGECAK